MFGIVASTVLASLITVFSYTRFDDVFTKIVLLSVLTAVIPYLFSAAAQLYWLLVRGREHLSPGGWPGTPPSPRWRWPSRTGRSRAAATRPSTTDCSSCCSDYRCTWLKRDRGEYGETGGVRLAAAPGEVRAAETVLTAKRLSRGLPTSRTGGFRKSPSTTRTDRTTPPPGIRTTTGAATP